MRDDIFYGNLLGLLKMGKWNLSIEESKALVAVENEIKARLSNKPLPVVKEQPIKKVKRGNK